MKISELLREAEEVKRPAASDLPSAASLDDVESAVAEFRKIGANFGPDLYSFSSIEYFSDWNARNATGLVAKVSTIDLPGMSEAASEMRSASGYYGGMTFIIVNGRTGTTVAAGFGEDAVSDGIVIDDLDADQLRTVDKINRVNNKYANMGGGTADEESRRLLATRQEIFELLNYPAQKVKTDVPKYKNIRSKFWTPEMAAAAFKNGDFNYIPDQFWTPEIANAAIETNRFIDFIPERLWTQSMLDKIIKSGQLYKFPEHFWTPSLINGAVKAGDFNIIPEKFWTKHIAKAAAANGVPQDWSSIPDKFWTPEIALDIARQNGSGYIPDRLLTPELATMAVKSGIPKLKSYIDRKLGLSK